LVATLIWLGLVVLAGLSVFFINGGALSYFDSPAYVDQGVKILNQLGLFKEVAVGDAAAATGAALAGADNTVNGSRSAVYSLIVGLIAKLGGVGLIPFVNVAVITLAAWLPVRILARLAGTKWSTAALFSLPLIVSMVGALSFYVAFVMPDILTGALLLMIATITVFHPRMHRWELVAAVLFGALAVLSHISHIAIAAALVPVVALAALILGNRRWWIAPLMVVLMVLAGVGERAVFRVAAQKVSNAEVVYFPFLTARLIQDGPGWRYLQAKCPASGEKSCALFAALSVSDDPYRLTASHIIFETDPNLGSFKLMSTQDQARVASEQYAFFARVFMWAPVSTSLAMIKNTLLQAAMNSVKMTIPDEEIMTHTRTLYSGVAASFSEGRMTQNRSWLAVVEPLHSALYILSLGVIAVFLVWPGRVPKLLKAFVIMGLLGVLANAFVSGAVSQPAARYGARAIWLLPFLATLMAMYGVGSKARGPDDEP
jgi:hypothetical protein